MKPNQIELYKTAMHSLLLFVTIDAKIYNYILYTVKILTGRANRIERDTLCVKLLYNM